MRHALVPPHSSTILRRHVLVAVALLSLALTGCPEPDPHQTGPTDVASATCADLIEDQRIERTSSGPLSANPDAITLNPSDSALRVELPVTAQRDLTDATAHVEIVSVDGRLVNRSEHTVDLDAGEQRLTLRVPTSTPTLANPDHHVVVVAIRTPEGDEVIVRRGLGELVQPPQLVLDAPRRIHVGHAATVRAVVRDANGLGISDVPIELIASPVTGNVDVTGTTDAEGVAELTLTLDAPGQTPLLLTADTASGPLAVNASVDVVDEARLHLTTDKPRYQPGQTIHVRMLLLSSADRRPEVDATILLELFDGRGNKIVETEHTTDDFGVAATSIQLADILNEGEFELRATLPDDTVVTRILEVEHYTLPRFAVDMAFSVQSALRGERLSGVIDARYLAGDKPVRDAEVELTTKSYNGAEWVPFEVLAGRTDSTGRFEFNLNVPFDLAVDDAGRTRLPIDVEIVDATGQSLELTRFLPIASETLDISVSAAGGQLAPGLENALHLRVSSGNGSASEDTTCTLAAAGGALADTTLTTDRYGRARTTVVPADERVVLEVSCRGPNEVPVAQSIELPVEDTRVPVLVDVERVVYRFGETLALRIQSDIRATEASVRILAASRTVHRERVPLESGRASVGITLGSALESAIDGELAGELQIEVTAFAGDQTGHDARVVFVEPRRRLDVTMTTDAPTYEPGDRAQVTFRVTDETGAPRQAMLGVQIIDEAVLALGGGQSGPTLEQQFRADDLDFFPVQFAALVEALGEVEPGSDGARNLQARAAAVLAELGEVRPTRNVVSSAAEVHVDNILERMIQDAAQQAVDGVRAAGCTSYDLEAGRAEVRLTDPWGTPWRMNVVSAWSRSVNVTTAGPDETFGTGDDRTYTLYL